MGLDIEDVDFKNNGIKVTRKGGNEMVVYFGSEVEKALKNYLEVRENIVPLSGHEHALFYSSQKKRIGVQAIENLVKKISREITTTKKITPHKLRSTYGTALYQETGDIYLVADVLGHRDVNTTKKHYAALDDARRRQAATAVKPAGGLISSRFLSFSGTKDLHKNCSICIRILYFNRIFCVVFEFVVQNSPGHGSIHTTGNIGNRL